MSMDPWVSYRAGTWLIDECQIAFFMSCLMLRVWTLDPPFLSLFSMSFVLPSTICLVSWIPRIPVLCSPVQTIYLFKFPALIAVIKSFQISYDLQISCLVYQFSPFISPNTSFNLGCRISKNQSYKTLKAFSVSQTLTNNSSHFDQISNIPILYIDHHSTTPFLSLI